MVAPAPPNRVEMSVEQHLEAVLAAWRTRPPSEKDVQLLEQFNLGAQAVFMGDPNAMGQEVEQGGGNADSLRGPEQEYGTQPDTQPVTGY